MAEETVRLGVIGCGGFGLFALQHLAQLPGVVPVAMAGTHRQAARAAAKRFGIPDIQEPEDLVQRDDVDLIYIATPPFLHHPQVMLALQAGKHVICEKPLAISLQQAEEMIATANQQGRLLAANLIQRYNPLAEMVRHLIERKVLGQVLHGFFENYAADEGLPPEHWFWDRDKSGGIFIEHGVHFFDLFAYWLGKGRVVAGQSTVRPNASIEEQVQCTVRYRDGVHVNFYHGFTQPDRMDRQRLRLLFERGELTLSEWVPTRAHIHAIADESGTRRLCELFKDSRLEISHVYLPKGRCCRGRHQAMDVYQMLELHYGEQHQKMHVYGQLIRALAADQIAYMQDAHHSRRLTELHARDALALAVEAASLSQAPP